MKRFITIAAYLLTVAMPLAITLPIEVDPSGQPVYIEDEARLPFTFDGNPTYEYYVHPDEP